MAKFTVEVDGKQYKCQRDIEGKRVFTQTIVVENMGRQEDTEQYSYKNPYKNIQQMEHFARVIARSIIGKSKKLQ